MAKDSETPTAAAPNLEGLPRNAPRRARVRLDFGRPPIGGAEEPCRIIDSEHKHRRGGSIEA